MILSHRHRFIFIKTEKTAGTSIEIAMANYCGPDDIIAPWSFDSKLFQPQNYQGYFNPFPEILRARGKRNLINSFRKRRRFFDHMSASQIKRQIDRDIWDSYFKFCFERNPWDKAVSYYWHVNARMDEAARPEFSEFIVSGRLPSDWPNYTVNDKVAVDYVGRFENLHDDLTNVCERLGIPFEGELLHTRGESRSSKQHYSLYYTDETTKVVERAFAKEINEFGYSFEDQRSRDPAR